MNTSEINPLHLSIPKIARVPGAPRAQPHIVTTKYPGAQPIPDKAAPPTQVVKLPESVLAGAKAGEGDQSAAAAAVAVSAAAAAPAAAPGKAPPAKGAAAAESAAAPAAAKPAAKEARARDAANDAALAVLMQNPDYLWFPVPTGQPVKFRVAIDGTYVKLCIDDGRVLLVAGVKGVLSGGLQITANGKPLAEGRVQRRVLCCTLEHPEGRRECCAIQPVTGEQLKQFDVLIPALKKIDGKSQMFPIPAAGDCQLVTKVAAGSKEVIPLKTRGGTDATFGGKMPAGKTNFILFHVSNEKRDLASLRPGGGKETVLEVGYPLSPLQGFIAAIYASVPLE